MSAPVKTSGRNADIVIQHAFALGQSLGLTERDIATSALRLAVAIAQRQPDPDAWFLSISKGEADAR